MYTQKCKTSNNDVKTFALSLVRLSIIGLFATTLLQGCILAQQPPSRTEISVTQPDGNTDSTPQHFSSQVIGRFAIRTEDSAAFLESIQFNPLSGSAELTDVRIKMNGDDEWLKPSEINIYLDVRQRHEFEIAAIIPQNASQKIDYSLSNFRFLKANATSSVNASTLTYSINNVASIKTSPQQSRS